MKKIIVLLTVYGLSSFFSFCKKEINITDNNKESSKTVNYSLAYNNDSISVLNDSSVIFNIKINPGGLTTKYFIEYGSSQNLLNSKTNEKIIKKDTSYITSMDTISSLIANTNYYFRINLSNIKDTIVSPIKPFKIEKVIFLPSIIYDTVSSILVTSAIYSAKINPRGLRTTYYFEYGTSNGYENKTTEKNIGSDSIDVIVRDTVLNLSPGSSYKYRLVVSNVNGKTMGIGKSFTTYNVILPRATLWQAKDITTNSATLEGWIKSNGKIVTYYFEYGETISYGMKSSEITRASNYDIVAVGFINSLKYGTQYHWRLHCRVDSGEVSSDDGVFTTINIANPIEFSYPLIVGTTLTYDYRLTEEDVITGSSPPSEQRKGVRIWEIKSKSVSSDSITTVDIHCTANDSVFRRVQYNMPPDTSYYSETIPFTIIISKDYISVGFEKIVKFARGNRSSPIVPLPRIVSSGTTTLQLGDVLYSNGIGLLTYRAGFFSNTGGYAETLILR